MKQKLDILEEKITALINLVTTLREENRKLKIQLAEKDSLLDRYKNNSIEAVERIDNIIEIIKKEGVFEETG